MGWLNLVLIYHSLAQVTQVKWRLESLIEMSVISMTIASSANSVTCKSMDACVNNDFYGFALQYTV